MAINIGREVKQSRTNYQLVTKAGQIICISETVKIDKNHLSSSSVSERFKTYLIIEALMSAPLCFLLYWKFSFSTLPNKIINSFQLVMVLILKTTSWELPWASNYSSFPGIDLLSLMSVISRREKLVRSYRQLIINTREPTAPVCCMFMKTSNHLARLKYSLSITERREPFSLYKHVMFYSRQLHWGPLSLVKSWVSGPFYFVTCHRN